MLILQVTLSDANLSDAEFHPTHYQAITINWLLQMSSQNSFIYPPQLVHFPTQRHQRLRLEHAWICALYKFCNNNNNNNNCPTLWGTKVRISLRAVVFITKPMWYMALGTEAALHQTTQPSILCEIVKWMSAFGPSDEWQWWIRMVAVFTHRPTQLVLSAVTWHSVCIHQIHCNRLPWWHNHKHHPGYYYIYIIITSHIPCNIKPSKWNRRFAGLVHGAQDRQIY